MSDYEAMRIHVYRDPQVEAVVARRFETFGATGSRADRGGRRHASSDGDPLVRGRASEVYFQSVSRNRITLQVLQRVLTSLAANKGRKSVILVSEGFIYDPNLDEFKGALIASRRSNAAIYFLDTKGLQGSMPYISAEFGPAIDTQDIGAAFLDQMQEAEGAESLAVGQRRLHRQEHQRPRAGDQPHRRRVAQLLPRRLQPDRRARATAASARSR